MEFKKYQHKKVKKGAIIQLAGDKNLKSYYVSKGLLRAYIIDDKAKEHIFMFAPEGWIIGDIHAVHSKTESKLYIDVLEDSEILILNDTIDDFSLEEIKPGIDKLLNRVGVLQNRLLMQMSSSALERYNYFLKIYPDLVQRVPQHMIASYLGITPQALSRLRSQIKH